MKKRGLKLGVGVLILAVLVGGVALAMPYGIKNEVVVIPTNTQKKIEFKASGKTYTLLIPVVLKSVQSPDALKFTKFKTKAGQFVPITNQRVQKKLEIDDRSKWAQWWTGQRELQLIECSVEAKSEGLEQFQEIHYELGDTSYTTPVAITVEEAEEQPEGLYGLDQGESTSFTTVIPDIDDREKRWIGVEFLTKKQDGAMEIFFDTPVRDLSYVRGTDHAFTSQSERPRIEYKKNEKTYYRIYFKRDPKYFSEVSYRFVGEVPPSVKGTSLENIEGFFDESLLSLCTADFCRMK